MFPNETRGNEKKKDGEKELKKKMYIYNQSIVIRRLMHSDMFNV